MVLMLGVNLKSYRVFVIDPGMCMVRGFDLFAEKGPGRRVVRSLKLFRVIQYRYEQRGYNNEFLRSYFILYFTFFFCVTVCVRGV